MSKVYRVAVIGMGFGQRVHVPAYHAHNRFQVVAVAGARPHSADGVAERIGATSYDRWEDLLEEADVDLVSIATAPHLHASIGLRALEGRHAILLEKPTALDAREAGSLVETARTQGQIGAISHEFRFRPAHLAVRDRLRQGAIGPIVAVHATVHSPGLAALRARPVGWLARWETGGGFLGAVGSHEVDTLLWWMDEPVVRVWADLRAVASQRPAADGSGRLETPSAEDSFVLFLAFASGAVATLTFTTAGAAFGETWDILGETGALRITDASRVDVLREGTRAPETMSLPALPEVPSLPGDPPDIRTALLSQLLDRLAAALDGDRQGSADLPGLDQGLRVQRVLDSAREANRTGTAIHLQPAV